MPRLLFLLQDVDIIEVTQRSKFFGPFGVVQFVLIPDQRPLEGIYKQEPLFQSHKRPFNLQNLPPHNRSQRQRHITFYILVVGLFLLLVPFN